MADPVEICDRPGCVHSYAAHTHSGGQCAACPCWGFIGVYP